MRGQRPFRSRNKARFKDEERTHLESTVPSGQADESVAQICHYPVKQTASVRFANSQSARTSGSLSFFRSCMLPTTVSTSFGLVLALRSGASADRNCSRGETTPLWCQRPGKVRVSRSNGLTAAGMMPCTLPPASRAELAILPISPFVPPPLCSELVERQHPERYAEGRV
jgi:hypothetical protein